MANVLPVEKQEAVIRCLVNGSSVRATERITGVHRDTTLRLMQRVAAGCEIIADEHMRGLSCERVQVDELWCYVGKKQRHVTPLDDARECGDFWTWIAIDQDTKLVPCYRIGKRDHANANAFVCDLASRLARRV